MASISKIIDGVGKVTSPSGAIDGLVSSNGSQLSTLNAEAQALAAAAGYFSAANPGAAISAGLLAADVQIAKLKFDINNNASLNDKLSDIVGLIGDISIVGGGAANTVPTPFSKTVGTTMAAVGATADIAGIALNHPDQLQQAIQNAESAISSAASSTLNAIGDALGTAGSILNNTIGITPAYGAELEQSADSNFPTIANNVGISDLSGVSTDPSNQIQLEWTDTDGSTHLLIGGEGPSVTIDSASIDQASSGSGAVNGSNNTIEYAANVRGDVNGSNDSVILQGNTGDHLGVTGTNEVITGDAGSNHVNLLGDNTSATVSGGGVVGLVGNSQTLTLGDQGETIQTAGGDQYDNVIGSGANIGYAANVRGDVTGNSDTVNLQGNTGDHLGVTGAGEVITGDTGSDHVNLLGNDTSATVYGGGVVGLVGNGQNLALGNQGDTVQTAAGDQNENVSGSGETIGFAANTSGNVSGQNDQVGLQSNSGDNVGVIGQGMVITGDGGNNSVNLVGNGTTATVYGGGYVGLVGNNETLQVATDQDFTIDVAPGQTNDAIYADNSTINLPGGWDGSIYGQGLTINMDPNSGSQVMVYGYDDTFNGNQGDSVGADAYDPSNPNDPYAPYQDGDPSPGTPYDPEDPDPTDPGDPGDPGDGEDPDDFGEEKLATNGRTATSHEAKLTSSSSDTHTSASNPSTIKTTPMAGDVASSSYPPEVAARVSQLVSAMATFGAPSASDTSSNTTTGASHPSLTVDPSQSGHAMQTVRHAA